MKRWHDAPYQVWLIPIQYEEQVEPDYAEDVKQFIGSFNIIID